MKSMRRSMSSRNVLLATSVLLLLLLFMAGPPPAYAGNSEFGTATGDKHTITGYISATTSTANAAFEVDQQGTGNIVEFKDGSSTLFSIADGGVITLESGATFDDSGSVYFQITGAAGDYIKIGDAGETTHSLAANDDLLVSGIFEADGAAYLDSTLNVTGITTATGTALLATTAGRVGIGTTAPSYRLEVPWLSGDAATTAYFGSSNASNDQIAVYGRSYSNHGVDGVSTSSIGVRGISTSSYGVYGSSTSYIGVLGLSTSYVGVWGESTTNRAGYFYRNNVAGTATTAVFEIVQDSATSETNTVLRIQGDGTGDLVNIFDGASEVVTILDGGNVGIGTTVPASTLDVVGSGKFQTTTNITNAFQVLTSGGTGALSVNTTNVRVGIGTTAPEATLAVGNYGSDAGTIRVNSASNNYLTLDGDGIINETSNSMQLQVNSDTKLQLDSTYSTFSHELRATADNITNALRVTQDGTGDIVNIFDGSTEVLTVLDGGNVGIGNTVPATGLHIGTAASTHSLNTANDVIITGKLEVDGETFLDGDINLGDIVTDTITVNGTVSASGTATFSDQLTVQGTALLATTAGRVGIGTTTPNQTLEVVGGVGIGSDDGVFIREIGSIGEIVGADPAGGNRNPLGLRAISTTQLYLNTDGHVGIATTAPAQMLHIAGSGEFDNNLAINGTLIVDSTSTLTGAATIGGSADGLSVTTDGALSDVDDALTIADEVAISATTITPALLITQSGTGNILNIKDGPTSVFMVEDGGQVGIGTTTPAQALDVAGTVEATGFKMTTSPQAGYFLTTDANGSASWAEIGSSDGAWTLSGTDLYPDDTSYDVGIGTTAPATDAALHVAGTGIFDGKVGIGTTTPGAVLEVNNRLRLQDGTAGNINFTNSSSNLEIATSSGGGNISIAAGNYLAIETYDDAWLETARFDENGNVGIGTTVPASTLSVSGSGLIQSSTNITKALQVLSSQGTSVFQVDTTNGRVGIGTTAPATTLEIAGGRLSLSGIGYLDFTRAASLATFSQPTLNSTYSLLLAMGSTRSFYIKPGSTSGVPLVIDTLTGQTANALDVRENVGSADFGTLKASITASGGAYFAGNVGIGNTVPATGLHIGTAASTHSLNTANDVIITGKLEVDGETFLDGDINLGDIVTDTITVNGTISASGTASFSDQLTVQGTALLATTAGRVGIGTTLPLNTLDVRGDIFTDRWLTQDTNTFLGVGVVGAGNLAHVAGIEGYRNTALGYKSLYANTDGEANTALGFQVLLANTTGSYNVGIGYKTFRSNTTGSINVAIGYQPLDSNINGGSNTALGQQALFANTSGSYNIGIGENPLRYNQTGSYNIAMGYRSGGFGAGAVNSFSNAVILGSLAGYNITTGGNNIMLGYKAGESLTTGTKNIVIGYDIDTPAVDSANTLNIGNLIYATGLDGADTTLSTGNVGIGTTVPASTLSVSGSGLIQSSTNITKALQVLSSQGTSVFSVDTTNGRVGVGTTAPAKALHIVNVTPLRLERSGYNPIDISFGGNAMVGDAIDLTFDPATTSNLGYVFYTANGAQVHALGINKDGLVGINNNNPAAKLDVYGSGRFITDAVAVVGLTVQGTASQSGDLQQWQISDGTVKALVDASGDFSNTGGQTDSEIFGAGANVDGIRSLAVGTNASALGGYSTALGSYASANGLYAIAIGRSSSATNTGAISIGLSSTSSTNGVALGTSANAAAYSVALGQAANAAVTYSIALGSLSTTTATKQFVVGADANRAITDIYFGEGVTNATPLATTIQTTGGTGTDIIGANIIIAAGKATGSGTGGDIIFSTSDMGATGATLQTLAEKMRITYDGNVGIGTTTPVSGLQVGAGTTGHSLSGTGDVYITGKLEVDGETFLDGDINLGDIVTDTITINGTVSASGTATFSDQLTVEGTALLATTAGRVGIGTTAPTNRLHVQWLSGDAASTAFFGSSNASNDQVALYGRSYSSYGVYGQSTSSYGVHGTSTSSIGVVGISTSNIGVYGGSTSNTGVYGTSITNHAGYFTRNNTAGTATTPVVSIIQDSATSETNTVLRIQGDGTGDLVNIFDGADEVVTILDGGNVGIGTTAPAELLQVVGTALFATTTGKVGIGITAPTAVFHAEGDGTASLLKLRRSTDQIQTLEIDFSSSGGSGANSSTRIMNTETDANIAFYADVQDGATLILWGSTGDVTMGHSGSGKNQGLGIGTATPRAGMNGADIIGSAIFGMTAGSKVGIGTTTPSTQLDVTGSGAFSGNVAITKHLAVGTNGAVSATTLIDMDETLTQQTGAAYGQIIDVNLTPAGALSGTTYLYGQKVQAVWDSTVDGETTDARVYAIDGTARSLSSATTGNINRISGVSGQALHYGTGTVATFVGVHGIASNLDTYTEEGNINNAYSFLADSTTNKTTGTITARYGLRVNDASGAGNLTNQYGVFIDTIDAAATKNYALYSAGGDNYFGGNVGIGTTAPATGLHIGTAASTHSLTSVNDVIITGKLEVDGETFLDGNINLGDAVVDTLTVNATVSASGTATFTDQVTVQGTALLATTAGRVGIGTTAPSQKLHVAGSGEFDNNVIVSGEATVGGGYGATGATISTAGVIQANGAITTDGALTADSTAIGGGYGATGVTISNAGAIQANAGLTIDGASTLTGTATLSKALYVTGYSVIGSWSTDHSLGFAGDLKVTGNLEVDGATYLDGDINLGDAVVDTLTVNATVSASGTATFTDQVTVQGTALLATTAGRVGIGTTTPSTLLEISAEGDATATTPTLQITNTHLTLDTSETTNRLTFYTNDSSIASKEAAGIEVIAENAGSNFGMQLFTSAGVTKSTGIYIDYLGKVGINGITSLDNSLEVGGKIESSSINGNCGLIMNRADAAIAPNDLLGQMTWTGNDPAEDTVGCSIRGYAAVNNWTTNDTPARLEFWTVPDNSSAETVKMVITEAGNVGIGTTAPSQKLHVAGSGEFDNNIIISGEATVGGGYGATGVTISNAGAIQANAGLTIDGASTLTGAATIGGSDDGLSITTAGALSDVDGTLAIADDASVAADLTTAAFTVTQTGTGNIVSFKDGITAIFTIEDGGQVGIGTTAPAQALDVAGTVEATGFKMTTSPQAGYFLTTDANGVASWAEIGSSDGAWTLSGTDLYPDDTAYRVAIGSTDPSQMLHVAGSGEFDNNIIVSGEATVGGGYGATGATISTAGVLQANGAITTDGALTADSTAIGGGYGSTGVTISNAGAIQANAGLTVDGVSTLSGTATLSKALYITGYSVIGAWSTTHSLGSAGDLKVTGNLEVDGATYLDGDINLGDAVVDTITVNGTMNTSGTATFSDTLTVQGTALLATTAGRVGIGTTAPTAQLNIYAGTVDNTAYGLTLSAAGTTTDRFIVYPSGNYGVVTRYASENDANFWDIQKNAGVSQMRFMGEGAIGIGTSAPAVSGVGTLHTTGTALFATTAGRVGIGTTAPGESLDVTSGKILAPAGTLTVPGLAFTSDSKAGFSDGTGWINVVDLDVNLMRFQRISTSGGSVRVEQFSTGATADTYPGYSFVDDEDTGLALYGIGQLSLTSGGATKLLVDSNGNVGIGTTAPTATLEGSANSITAAFQITQTGTGDLVNIKDGITAVFNIADTGATTLRTVTDSTTGIQVLDADGGTPILNIDTTNERVGIGTTALEAALHITGDGSNPEIKLSHGGSNTFATIEGPENRSLRLDLRANGGGDSLVIRDAGTYGGGDLMVVQANGLVGIATTTPSHKLQVAGSGKFDNDLVVSGYSVIGAWSTTHSLGSAGDLKVTGKLEVDGETFLDGDINLGDIVTDTITINGTISASGTASFSDQLTVQGTALLATTAGNVGIGTTAPVSLLNVDSTTGGVFTLSRNDAGVSEGNLIGEIDFYGNDDQLSNSNIAAYIKVVAASAWGSVNPDGVIHFGTANEASVATTKMVINRDGNVGIGTTAPGQILEVIQSSGVPYGAKFGFSGTDRGVYIGQAATTRYPLIGFNASYYGSDLWRSKETWGGGIYGYSNGINFVWDSSLTVDTNYTPTTRMLITNTGNVGIGTTAPAAKLDVIGSGRFITDAAAVIGLTVQGTASQSGDLQQWQINDGTVKAHIDKDGEYSNTGGQSGSEIFGDGASVSSTNSVAIGYNAVTTGHSATSIGQAASAGQTTVAIGRSTIGTGNDTVAIGTSATTGATYSVVIGSGADAANASYQVAIGRNATTNAYRSIAVGFSSTANSTGSTAIGDSTTATGNATAIGYASNAIAGQFVSGSSGNAISSVIFGEGYQDATPSAYGIYGTSGTGTDISAGDIYFGAGRGTGTGVGGDIYFKTAAAGTTGSSLNSYTDRMIITDDGKIGIGNTVPATGLHIGTAASTHSLTSANDVIITGKLEVDGETFLDGDINLGDIVTDTITINGTISASGTASFSDQLTVQGTALLATTAGRVGIGTTAPDSRLHVLNADNTTLTIETTGAGYSRLYLDAGSTGDAVIRYDGGTSWAAGVDNSDSDNFKIATATSLGSSDRLTITTTGSAGIGTTTPIARTHIVDVDSNSPGLVIGAPLASDSVTGIGFQGYVAENNSIKSAILHTRKGNYGVGDLVFALNYDLDGTNVSVSDEVMRLQGSSGNVGIGTTAPAGQLHTTGTALFATTSGQVGIGTTVPGYKLHVDGTFGIDTNSSTQPLYITRLGATDESLAIHVNDDDAVFTMEQDETTAGGNGGFAFYMDADGTEQPEFRIFHGANERFRVQSDGNVGIGTTAPTATLEGSANSITAAFQITQTGTGNIVSFKDGITAIFTIEDGGQVGIGTTAPAQALDVAGTVEATGFKMTTSPTAGYFLTSDANGVASWAEIGSSSGAWTLTGNDLYPDSAAYRVAIGSTLPSQMLHVAGSGEFDNNIIVTGQATVGGGYGSTGATISTAGVIQANGAITTDGTLTSDNEAIGGGYGSTGVTISNAGVIQANGALTIDGASTLTGAATIGGSADGLSVTTDGALSDVDDALTIADEVAISATTITPALLITQSGTGNLANLKDGTTAVFTVADGGALTIKTTTDSTTGIQILDADGGTPILNIDTTNERVGVGTTAPAQMLHVAGSGEFDNNIIVTGQATVGGGYGSTGVTISNAGAIQANAGLTVDGASTLTGTATLSKALYVTGYSVIGAWSTTHSLGSAGDLKVTGNLEVDGETFLDGDINLGDIVTDTITINGTISASGTASFSDQLTVQGTALLATTAGRVGIGTTAPSQALDLIGSLELETTTTSTTGVIYKGADRFIHNFELAGTDGRNTFVGQGAGNFTMTGSTGALGSYNTANGAFAFTSNTTGYYNTANGALALGGNTTGYRNTANGRSAGNSITTGWKNTFLGNDAGSNASQKVDAENSMALGYGAYTTASNQVVIGNTSVTQTLLNGSVGIGTTAPASGAKLHVAGSGVFDSKVGIGTTVPSELLQIEGNLRFSSGAGSYIVTPSNQNALYFPAGYAGQKAWAPSGFHVQASSTANVTLTVQAISSQTTNLQDWTASTGAIKARINTVGGAYFADKVGIGNNVPAAKLDVIGSGRFITDAAAVVGLTVQGTASQSANLQEWQDSTGTIVAKIENDGIISVPGSGANSERFGAGTTADGTQALAIGYNSSVNSTGSYGIAIGQAASCTGASGALALGRGASATSSYGIGIGRSATASGYGISIGYQTNTEGSSIAIGRSTTAPYVNSIAMGRSAITTASYQFVAGSDNLGRINSVYFGEGVTNATPIAYGIYGTSGTGTDIIGGDVYFGAGRGTGTGVGGDIYFKTASAGTTGSSLNAYTDRMIITDAGLVGIGTTAPATGLHIGTAASTHSLNTANDVIITGKLEVDGETFLDGDINLGDIVTDTITINGTISASGTASFSDQLTVQGTALLATTAGRVGIGTTAPGYRLEVPWLSGDAVATAYFGSTNASNNQNTLIARSYSGWGVYGQSTGSVGVRGESTSSQGVYGQSTSNIGVYGTSTTNKSGYFYRNNTAGTATTAVFEIIQDSATSETNTVLRIQGDGTGDLVNIFDGADEVVTVLDGGNVGIGTTAPATALDVSGTATLENVTISGAVTLSSNAVATNRIVLSPNDAMLSPSAPPKVRTVAGTNSVYSQIEYDAATAQRAIWNFYMPDDYNGGNVTVKVYWTSTATTGDCVFDIEEATIADSAAIDASLTVANGSALTTDATAGDINVSNVTLTAPWTADNLVNFQLVRDADEAGDTLAADADVHMVVVEYNRTSL